MNRIAKLFAFFLIGGLAVFMSIVLTHPEKPKPLTGVVDVWQTEQGLICRIYERGPYQEPTSVRCYFNEQDQKYYPVGFFD